MPELHEFKKRFDPLFINFLKKCIDRTLVYYPQFASVGEHLVKLATGGKRLRPFVTTLTYNSGTCMFENGDESIKRDTCDWEALLPALFSLELYQTFALIHDDIMDNAKTRHGVETIHTHFDMKQALLTGDQCLVWAMRAITDCEKTTKKELAIFLQLAEETNIGQMIDTSLNKRRDISEKLLDTSIELKTARYTFIYPALLGLSLGSGTKSEDKNIIDKYQRLGYYLGLAFQRLDDLSDILADEAELGKKSGSDITEDTPTHLSHYFDQHATLGQKEIFAVYRGQPLDRHDIIRVRELFTTVGAIAKEQKVIYESLTEAEKVLASIIMTPVSRYGWQSIIDFLQNKLNKLSESLA